MECFGRLGTCLRAFARKTCLMALLASRGHPDTEIIQITSKLDYLKQLGVDIVWVSPS